MDVWTRANAETVDALAPYLARLEAKLGPATPVLLCPEGLEQWRETFRICQACEIWDVHGKWVTGNTPNFGPGIKERFEIASKITTDEYASESLKKVDIQEHIKNLISPETVIVIPTSPGPAPLREEPEIALNDFRMRAFEMLCTAGLAGLPQLSVPSGHVDHGPVGLSLIGSFGQDRQLISLASVLDDTTET